jgi:hypothetical protein
MAASLGDWAGLVLGHHEPRWQVAEGGPAAHRRCSTMTCWGVWNRRWTWASGSARRAATVGSTTVRHCSAVRFHRHDQVLASMPSATSAGDCAASAGAAGRWSMTVRLAEEAASSIWRSSLPHLGSSWLRMSNMSRSISSSARPPPPGNLRPSGTGRHARCASRSTTSRTVHEEILKAAWTGRHASQLGSGAGGTESRAGRPARRPRVRSG